MSEREYIVNFGDDRSSAFVRLAMAEVEIHGAKLREEIIRCKDCRHATINVHGVAKYCEKWLRPDDDGYGPIADICLPPDFFCGYGERKVDE